MAYTGQREDSYYNPAGVPITPQARRFGYEFPVYVSSIVWSKVCIAQGIPSKHAASLEQRIWHLLQYCYEGMAKKMAADEGFLYYEFKAFYWDRSRPNAKKKQRWKLGARLFLDASTDGPWLYIFAPNVDSIDALERGTPDEQPDETTEALTQGKEASGEAGKLPSVTSIDLEVQFDAAGSGRDGPGSERRMLEEWPREEVEPWDTQDKHGDET